MTITNIKKRDGRTLAFDLGKITSVIIKAFEATQKPNQQETAARLASEVLVMLEAEGDPSPDVEHIQDLVERVLMDNGFIRTAKAYILYRAERSRVRDMGSRLMKVYEDITFKDAADSDIKRENANVNGDSAMGTMLKYGSEGAKQFYEMFVLKPEHAEAHKAGDIHIHDLDFLTLTTTCCQIDIIKLFKGGFWTGHGTLREPQHISSYAALGCIAIQSNQNDQHGGQSIVNFDRGMAIGVAKTYRELHVQNLARAFVLLCGMEDAEAAERAKTLVELATDNAGSCPKLECEQGYLDFELSLIKDITNDAALAKRVQDFIITRAQKETDHATYKAMVALVHNLNTMHSRAGAQTPFSSINYGLDTTPEGRMVIKNVLLATEQGLGNHETPIFPIQIFRVMKGVSFEQGDPNYDLFRLAMRVSAKRLFPNFSFMDAPFNMAYYKGTPETEIAYMGCRTRVIGNVYDPSREISNGRGNLSFTSINLPRMAIKANGNIQTFFEDLDRKLDLVIGQLYERYLIQSKKKVRNFPFLMANGIWLDADTLEMDDEVGEVLKHGTLSLGFIGLAETLKALVGAHHGESTTAQNLGLDIIAHMRARLDAESKRVGMNYTLLATPGEGLSGRFVTLDAEQYGVIEGVTDREYYTNSFHIPVYYPMNAMEKIAIEAPYHALTNAGHITYVELDGDTATNLDAFEKILRAMQASGVGYGAINHPVDRDPICGFVGVIADQCPGCGRTEDDGVKFNRIRRITGYLSDDVRYFNNAKRAEERDRVKHDVE